MRVKNKLLEDIGDHLSDRVHDQIVDALDTCRRMDVPYRDAVSMVTAVMAAQFAATASAFKLTEEEFVKFAAMAAQGRLSARQAPKRSRAPGRGLG